MALLVLAFCASAHAHAGATPSVAAFTSPANPSIVHAEPSDTFSPYTFASADGSFTVSWNNALMDPTGRFTFYYLDHAPLHAVDVTEIERLGIKINDPDNNSGGYFVSCFCSADMGVLCPPVPRDPNGNCNNHFSWNTTAIPRGTYWIAAVNNDPPFHVYNAGDGPVRIAHQGDPLPPAIIVLRPDGFGNWDRVYHLQWLAVGTPPLSFDLEYGIDDPTSASVVVGAIALGIQLTAANDGTFNYDWDISALDAKPRYWVRFHVTDGNGFSTFTDSHYPVTVYRDATPPADMAVATMPPPPPKKKSGCAIADSSSPPSMLLLLLFATRLGLLVARARRRRRAA
jgi:hypothetical protein